MKTNTTIRMAIALLGLGALASAAGALTACDPGPAGEAEAESSEHSVYGSSRGTQLSSGQRLLPGQSLVNNGYELIMQNDCNLVLYDFKSAKGCDVATHSRVLWSSNTHGQAPAGSCYAFMQPDGNLVIYTANLRAIWATNTNGIATLGNLRLQSDGNAVIYTGSNARWATNTNVNPSGARRSCTAGLTYCCTGRVHASYNAVTGRGCRLLSKGFCEAWAATVTCNNFPWEEINEVTGDLHCLR